MCTETKEIMSYLTASNEKVGEYYLDFLNNIVIPFQKSKNNIQDKISINALNLYAMMVILVQKKHYYQLSEDAASEYNINDVIYDGESIAKSAQVSFIIYDENIYDAFDLRENNDLPDSHDKNLTKDEIGGVVKNQIGYLMSKFDNEEDLINDILARTIHLYKDDFICDDFELMVKIGMSTYSINITIDILNG